MNQLIPFRVFALGMLWAIVSAMAPVGVLLWRWISLWQDPPDWRIIGPVAITCAATGAIGFWRKYKALLQLPPTFQLALDLATQIKTVKTTETVEHQQYPAATVTTTVEETKTTAAVLPDLPDSPAKGVAE